MRKGEIRYMKELMLILLLSICAPAILLLALALAFIAIMIVLYAVCVILGAPGWIAMWIDEHKKV